VRTAVNTLKSSFTGLKTYQHADDNRNSSPCFSLSITGKHYHHFRFIWFTFMGYTFGLRSHAEPLRELFFAADDLL
jgi:hypothetical protein